MSKKPGLVWLAALGLLAVWLGPPALADPPGQPGALDTSFPQTGGPGDEVTSLALQPDGKILAGGAFTTYNGTAAPGLVRLNADGTRDAWFNQTGTGLNSVVNALALQPDGKILVGGAFTTYNGAAAPKLIRLNADGTRDATFAQTGTGLSNDVHALALQPDGKILAGGYFLNYNGAPAQRMIRLNANGTRDASFTLTGAGLNGVVETIALQPDGKIMAGGYFSTYDGTQVHQLVRLNADGTRDLTFDQTGTGISGTAYSIVVQPNAKILVGGAFTQYDTTPIRGIIRLNADGTRDATFTPTGSGLNASALAVALQPDARVVVVGEFTTYNGSTASYVARLNSDGTRDATFNQTGTGLNDVAASLVLQPDGRVVVGGRFTRYNGTNTPRVTRVFGAAQPALSVSPASLAFGSQPVWLTTSALTATVTNSGTAPLIFGPDAVSLTGINPGQFAVTGDTCSSSSLAPAATCSVLVSFAPTSVGAKSARLNLNSNAGTSPDRLTLSGSGTAPGISMSTGALAFGTQTQGTTSGPQIVTLVNNGVAPLTFGAFAVTVAGPDARAFEVIGDSCSASSIPASGSCAVSVRFAPFGVGTMTGRLNLTSNAGTSPDHVLLSGTGDAAPAPSPNPTVTVTPAPAPTVTVTPAPIPQPPGKPSDLAASATPKQIHADWASPPGVESYLVKVSGTDPKKNPVTKTTTTTRASVAVKARLKTRSKAVVCVRAVNAAGASAQTCTSVKVR